MTVASFISQSIFLIHCGYIREKYELKCKLHFFESYIFLIARMAEAKYCQKLA